MNFSNSYLAVTLVLLKLKHYKLLLFSYINITKNNFTSYKFTSCSFPFLQKYAQIIRIEFSNTWMKQVAIYVAYLEKCHGRKIPSPFHLKVLQKKTSSWKAPPTCKNILIVRIILKYAPVGIGV